MGDTFIVDVSPILGESGATLEIDADLPLGSMIVGDSEVCFSAPPQLRATLANLGDVGLLSGTVEATARLDCSRCLEPFELPLSGTLDAVISDTDDPDARNEDQEWYALQGDSVDVLPAAESALRVEVPFAPVHHEACRGICPTCGCDLNRDECTCEPHAETRPDSPFASLKDLLPPDQE
jgi:uncharacterized protein